ncbi:hypothetical protein [Streptomyces sp. NPDC002788]
MTNPSPTRGPLFAFAEDLTSEDVTALETFLNTHLGRMYDEVGPTGEIFFAMRSLLILVSDSAGLLHSLLRVKQPDAWQRAAIVREWQRLRGTAADFNHCDGYDHDRWWDQVRHYNAADEAAEQDRIRRIAASAESNDAIDQNGVAARGA